MDGHARELADGFDLERLTPKFYADPYPTYRALREHAPVKRLPNGCYFLTRYDDLIAAYKNTRTFSSDKKTEFLPKYRDSLLYEHHTTSLVFNDPPAHTRVRRLIMGALSPRAIAGMEPDLIALVDSLLDRIAAKERFELIEDFASAIPVEVIGNLLDVPRSTFVDAKWNTLNEKVWESFAEVDHALDNGGQFKTTVTYRDAETPQRNFTWADGAVDPDTGDSWAVAYDYYTHIKTIGVDSFVTTPFEFANRRHEFTVGAEYQHLDKDFTYGGGEYFPINVWDPGSIDIPRNDYAHVNGNWSKSDQYGVYTRAKLNVTDWLDVIGGSRVTWYESDAKNANAFFNNFGQAPTSINRKVIPYGAVIGKITPELSTYFSYTGVFKPQSEIGTNGEPVGPRKGKQY